MTERMPLFDSMQKPASSTAGLPFDEKGNNKDCFIVEIADENETEYYIEYSHRFTTKKTKENNIYYVTIQTNNLNLLLELHNFTTELFKRFRTAYTEQKLSSISCYSVEHKNSDTEPFIVAVEVDNSRLTTNQE